MTNEMARRPTIQLPAEFILPAMPGGCYALYAWIAMVNHPHPDIPLKDPPAAVRHEATQALQALEAMMHGPSITAVEAFLWPVADAVEYTPSEEEFYRKVKVLFLSAHEIPHVAFTLAAQRELCRTCRRFPSIQQILEVIEPGIAALRRRVTALETIIRLRS